MPKKKLNTDLDDSLKKRQSDDDFDLPADLPDDVDPAILAVGDEDVVDVDVEDIDPAAIVVSDSEEDDSINYTMGSIQVDTDEEDSDADASVVVLPDVERPGDDENWEADYNMSDSDDFLDLENYDQDDDVN